MKVLDFTSKAFIVLSPNLRLAEIHHRILMENGQKVIVYDGEKILKVFSGLNLLKRISIKKENNTFIGELAGDESFFIIDEKASIDYLLKTPVNHVIVVNKRNYPFGIIDDISGFKSFFNYASDQKKHTVDYKEIVECLEEEIFVTNEKGCIHFLNPMAEKICGIKANDVIGKHVTDLEKEKIISSSISLEVIKAKKKVNIYQKLKSGKTVLSTAVPIFDQNGILARVLITSKDIQEINKLMEEIEKKKTELEKKKQQFNVLREGIFAQDNFVCKSPKMNEIKELIKRIALTDLTVLIQGESGVGKEVVAKLVHNLSQRNIYPFVKINCGAIPEALLESELFGYESGAFTGASKSGKLGKIELANHGTLFLDEIGEMPLPLQVKILEFLQDREITRVGGTKKITINTRIIAATNCKLEEMVQGGRFRQDLFYRLNVFPIMIPPLRERKEDIPVLAVHFLEKYNNKYKMNKKFDHDVIKTFMEYDWPGNVRELEHVVERAAVVSLSEVIVSENSCDIFKTEPSKHTNVICPELMPLKEAKRVLETQLVQRAYDVYRSTYKAAKVLQVDQSTVVRLLKKGKQLHLE